ncbi:MAG: MBL fold metallo-hydrolase [Devosia sp.]
MTVTLHCHGAAGTVTGSCYRVDHPGGHFLVDCGMFQGNRSVRALNLKPTPFDPKSIDFLLLTHAHIDHVGLLPKLYAEGWRGPAWMTEPTAGLLEYMLPDSAGIQESEAERASRKASRRGDDDVTPLYTMQDAEEALKHRQTCPYEQWIEPGPGVRARFWNAGHIIGSASIEVEVMDGDKAIRLMFSGDIGPDEKVFYNHPEGPAGFDYIVCESTYGGREREDYTLLARREALKAEINTALGRGGNLLIPTFAVERSQELLHDIGYLIKTGEIDPTLVFLDSPLASKVTSVYRKYAKMFEDVELGADELFNDPRFRIIESVADSQAINTIKGGAIIMSASGMCDAGRIKHHLRANLIRRNATVLFVGYQAPGTMGHVILTGARQARIHGKLVPIRANIRSLGNYSAHADHSELMDWIKARLPAHGAIFLTHGEDEERNALRTALMATGLAGDQIILPQLDDYFELTAAGIAGKAQAAVQRIDPNQVHSDWHNVFSDFTIRLSQQLQQSSDAEKLALMQALQQHLSALGAPVSPGHRPTAITPVETQSADE